MRRFGFCCLGAVAGHFVGWFLAICWAGITGNLMMPEPEYEKRRGSILLTIWLIVGASSLLAGFVAAWTLGGRGTDPEKPNPSDASTYP
jgi:hypothetical protein